MTRELLDSSAPGSLPAAVYDLLRATAREPQTRTEIAAALDAEVSDVSRALWQLCEATRRPGGRRRGVVRVSRGAYAYEPDADRGQHGQYTHVGGDDDAVILRGPDGQLWLARPLPGTQP